MDRGAVFYARADGSFIKEAAFLVITPNGVGISPDGERLYVAETETSRLWAYPIIGAGKLEKQPWPSPNGGKLVGGRVASSASTRWPSRSRGNICVATLVTGGITVFSPDGEIVEF